MIVLLHISFKLFIFLHIATSLRFGAVFYRKENTFIKIFVIRSVCASHYVGVYSEKKDDIISFPGTSWKSVRRQAKEPSWERGVEAEDR